MQLTLHHQVELAHFRESITQFLRQVFNHCKQEGKKLLKIRRDWNEMKTNGLRWKFETIGRWNRLG